MCSNHFASTNIFETQSNQPCSATPALISQPIAPSNLPPQQEIFNWFPLPSQPIAYSQAKDSIVQQLQDLFDQQSQQMQNLFSRQTQELQNFFLNNFGGNRGMFSSQRESLPYVHLKGLSDSFESLYISQSNQLTQLFDNQAKQFESLMYGQPKQQQPASLFNKADPLRDPIITSITGLPEYEQFSFEELRAQQKKEMKEKEQNNCHQPCQLTKEAPTTKI